MVGKFRVSGMGRGKVLEDGRGLKLHDTCASLSSVHRFICGLVVEWLDKGDVSAECFKLFSARHQMPASL
jgi:hypothetical protein